MHSDTGQPIRLSDYRVSDYLIDEVHLSFSLHRTQTRVIADLKMRPHPDGRAAAPLRLDGDAIHLINAWLDGELCKDAEATADCFVLAKPPQRPFTLRFETDINPSTNTELMGLFRSGAAYCTQCEAEGFRRITYFLDRPDVMAIYTTRIEADIKDAPILLGNGNCIETGPSPDPQRHYAVWHDPFPKPCYLFALVAGDLEKISDHFITAEGQKVDLAIYVEHGKGARALYAMDALKRAMAWDEHAFGRVYDLTVFNIVAVSDFNMGAMENKSLNVFNDKYVLASSASATDADYANIESVIAHEYFHNWTGNRITCRDWFQLCLKEGLTVFRDQEFSSDQRSRAVKRISDVRNLRATQFVEDAGPLAHNVRPDLYHEINNFYTATIYDKGAELIRLLKTWIGATDFARGMDLYFQRFDGTAATIENFIDCFASVSGRDMSDFMRWYEQAGTPCLSIKSAWDAQSQIFTLTLSQHTPPTPQQDTKLPVLIPVALGLLSRDGQQLALRPADPDDHDFARECERGVFELRQTQRILRFASIPSAPVISALQNFSAPVNIDMDVTTDDLICLLAHDRDDFNRWQAAQNYALRQLRQMTDEYRAGQTMSIDAAFAHALEQVLSDGLRDPAFTALVLSLPSENDVARELARDIDPEAIHHARHHLKQHLGQQLGTHLRALYQRLDDRTNYAPDAAQAGRRMLKNVALDLLAAGDQSMGRALAAQQCADAQNMTDRFAALSTLTQIACHEREQALAAFYHDWADDPLVLDKWFALQASIAEYGTLERVQKLRAAHADMMGNPNRLRALIGTFAMANPMVFHAPDGSGYALLAGIVSEVDQRNPQIAARLLSAFRSWRSLEPTRAALAQKALENVAARENLSNDVRDIVTRSLQ